MRIRSVLCIIQVVAVFFLVLGIARGGELIALKNCKFIPTEWSDGDSFLIRTEDGTEHTLRLYGADCFEWHVTDDSDARRLREQRRYFGISGFGGSSPASIAAAKELGKAAADEIAVALKQPFTVHTAFSDARGDGKFKRIYGFVTTAAGEDLSERLVGLGLARAFGVYRQTPKGRSSKDYRAYLHDVELRAAKRGIGAWAKTDWEKLPSERQAEREENQELSLATAGPKLPAGEKVNLNNAARDQLMLLPGVGEITANRIIEARPFKIPSDLLDVDGIGPKTLERLQPFIQLP
jgi:competence protein ComEA